MIYAVVINHTTVLFAKNSYNYSSITTTFTKQVLLQKLTRLHLVKKLSTLYETQTFTEPTTTTIWRHVLLEKLIFVEVLKTFLAFHGERRSSNGLLINFIYMFSLNMRFYFHNSRHENNEIIEGTKFKR